MKFMRIIFFGTPEFAVPALEILIKNGFEISAVITAPDKPAGRGLKLHISPVKECALKNNLLVLQPEKLKDIQFYEFLKNLKPDLGIVVAFRMLPDSLFSLPKAGTFNLHASLLPDYRGAAPISWAIINGEQMTGMTTFFLKHEIDTGDIIFQEKMQIDDSEDAGSLHDKLKIEGAKLILKTVEEIRKGTIKTYPQLMSEGIKKAPKIFRDVCELNWELPVKKVYDKIRGLSPYPGAWSKLNGKILKIFESSYVSDSSSTTHTGEIITDQKTFIKIKCADGFLTLKEIQMEGKARMNTQEFLRGNKI